MEPPREDYHNYSMSTDPDAKNDYGPVYAAFVVIPYNNTDASPMP